jgi:PPOX class probable F420-dependent enzyme
MSASLSDTSRGILDGANFATIATLNPDGSPQTSVVWVKREGDDLLMSTLAGRRKERNMRRDSRISVSVYDLKDPQKYFEVRGNAEITEAGGRELIEELSRKYTGAPFRKEGPEAVRVVVRLTPLKAVGYAQ